MVQDDNEKGDDVEEAEKSKPLKELEEKVLVLQAENAELKKKLRESKIAYEATKETLQAERARRREELNRLSIQVKEAEGKAKASSEDAASLATRVQKAEDEVAALESALANAEKDYQRVLDKLEAGTTRRSENERAADPTVGEQCIADDDCSKMPSSPPSALGGAQSASSNSLSNDENVISQTLKSGGVSTNNTKTPGAKMSGRRALSNITNNTENGR